MLMFFWMGLPSYRCHSEIKKLTFSSSSDARLTRWRSGRSIPAPNPPGSSPGPGRSLSFENPPSYEDVSSHMNLSPPTYDEICKDYL